jgi:hypothetical protein
MPIQTVASFSKYLGLPTISGRSKNQIFNFIIEKIWKKLKGWKERHLSFAGRSTLIKAVAQAIPTYIMSSILIPKGVCEEMEKMICKFWWGSTTDQRKIHWVNWHKLCNHKKKGGLGFKNLSAFNEALLAKQGWRLINQPNSLVAQVLKAKYYPKDHFLKARPKQQMSYTWRNILKASWVLKKGCYWSIGDGNTTNIWEDNWIHQHGNSTTWSNKPEGTTYTMVKDILNNTNNGWNETLINQLFLPYEAQQILNIPLLDSAHEDTITWDGTPDGNYSVKSGYQAIMQWKESNQNTASTSNQSSRLWDRIWKLNVPPKHNHLLWRIMNNALPVKTNLAKKGVRCDPFCPRCPTTMETINHVFLECDWAKQVWIASPLTLNLSNNPIPHMHDWITNILNTMDKEYIE